jgi:hypothetical protein
MTGQPANRTGRIDVQFHFSPPFYTDLIKATSYIGTDRWSADAALAYMDANHVAVGVMSVSTPRAPSATLSSAATLSGCSRSSPGHPSPVPGPSPASGNRAFPATSGSRPE